MSDPSEDDYPEDRAQGSLLGDLLLITLLIGIVVTSVIVISLYN